MGLSKNIGQYTDVDIVLTAAVKSGGARYQLPTEKDAVRWRQRAYFYRKLLYDLELERVRHFPGLLPATPYDGLTLRIEGNFVVITLDRATGKLTSLDGTELEIERAGAEEDDELAKAAKAFAEGLG